MRCNGSGGSGLGWFAAVGVALSLAACANRPDRPDSEPVLEAAPSGADLAGGEAGNRAPNVLVWMMDDVGFAQVSSFGGLVPTPNIDRVAEMGLRYTNYHTAPICSAARASFLSGRNPHSVHIGGHATAALPAGCVEVLKAYENIRF